MNMFLIINIGGTSTKVALFDNENLIKKETIRYEAHTLEKYDGLWDQLSLRQKGIEDFLKENKIKTSSLEGIITRGPLLKPIGKGVYTVNEKMVDDAKSGRYGMHPTNLGVVIAKNLGMDNVAIYTVDPPTSDELIDIARVTGLPGLERKSIYQVLNHHTIARKYALSIGKKYEDLNLVITHLGSGISVASHKNGKVIDVTNGLGGDGPMGLDRTGTLAAKDLLMLIKNNEKTVDELLRYQNGAGGIKAYLNTIDAREIEDRIVKGDEEAKLIYEAMAFQVSKALGAASTALGCKPDAIIITGGLANSKYFTSLIKSRVEWISDVVVLNEENEINALIQGVLEALKNENIKSYK